MIDRNFHLGRLEPDYFYKWRKDIGFDATQIKDYKFDAFYDEPSRSEIEFGNSKDVENGKLVSDIPEDTGPSGGTVNRLAKMLSRIAKFPPLLYLSIRP